MIMGDRVTYYMVEMDYPHETEQERTDFDNFYDKHITMLLTIPGFLTAQRFYCPESLRAPFLAIYRLSAPEVLTSRSYTSKAGRMSVDPAFRVNMKNWDRNIVQGPIGTVEPDLSIEKGETITMVDRLDSETFPLPEELIPMDVVGLDQTVVQRGVATRELFFDRIEEGWEIRKWRPIHDFRVPPRKP